MDEIILEIDCTGDVVIGDTILFTESVFGPWTRRKRKKVAKPVGTRTVVARVVRDSYGAGTQQHTFTLEVLASHGEAPIAAGQQILRKGRNVYRNGTRRLAWADEAMRQSVRVEKHARGDAARTLRRLRLESDWKWPG